jgi:hypothetical protein
VVLPGLDDADRRDDEKFRSIATLLKDLFASGTDIARLEALLFPGQRQQELLITGIGSSATAGGHQATLTSINATGQKNVDYELTPATEAMKDSLLDALPDEYGLEACRLDIGTLDNTLVATSRLAIEKNRDPVALANLTYHPLVRLQQGLWDAGVPHVYQLVLTPGSNGSPLVTVRLAPFTSSMAVVSENDYRRLADQDPDYELGTLFGPAGFRSNFDAWVRDQGTHVVSDNRRTYGKAVAAPGCKRPLAINREFRELWAARPGYHNTYTDVGLYPKMPLDWADLDLVVGVCPLYHDRDLWAETPFRRPRVVTEELIKDAAGTSHGYADRATVRTTAASTVANEGGQQHQSLGALADSEWPKLGIDFTLFEQDTTSKADGEATMPDGTRRDAEFASKELSKPAKTLTNVDRALADERVVMYAVESRDDAERLAKRLARPYAAAGPRGVRLYNTTDYVEFTDGMPVLPADKDEAAWVLTHDGTLTLHAVTAGSGSVDVTATGVDTEVLVTGPADAAIETLEFATPRVHDRGDEYVVTGPDGQELATYTTLEALIDDWTRIYEPCDPKRLCYLESVAIWYASDGTLVPYDPQPDWTGGSKSEEWERALTAFLEAYTVTAEGAELPKEDVRKRFELWFGRQGDHDPPDENWFGRALPDTISMKRREENGSERQFFKNRTWRYPRAQMEIPTVGDDRPTPAEASSD